MTLLRSLLALALLGSLSTAQADKFTRFKLDKYAGGGLWGVSYEPDEPPDYSLVGGMLKAGYELSPTLAVEGHFGLTDGDTQTVFGDTVPVELRINALAGVFARLSYLHLEERGWARIYGLLGFSVVEVEASAQGSTAEDSDSGVSFGVGVELFGSDHTAIALEWVRYIQQSDYTIDTPMVGLVYRF